MTLLKATLVVSIAGVAAFALRNRSAALRHAVLAFGIAAAGLLPLLELIAPAWGSAMLPGSTLPVMTGGDRSWLALVWASGSAAGLLTLAAGLARVAWLRASATAEVSDRWQSIADEVTREFGIRRAVALLESPRAVMPVTWGVVQPRILLPRAANDWSDDRLRAVLRHEMAHIARGDWAVHLMAALVSSLYWFVPVMWLANRRLRIESERACDDAVLNLGADAPDYAGHLVAIARALALDRGVAAVTPAAARIGFLERRVTAALDPRVVRAPMSAAAVVLVACAATVISLPVAGFGLPEMGRAASILEVQRDIMMRFGGEERRFSIVSNDVSFWRNRIEGRVELQARLNVDGSVSAVRFVEPVHPDLANAATALVRNWRREPAVVRGVPVAVPIRMTVDFRR